MATKKLKRVAAKARNLLHDHPLLKKGGRHEQSKKSKRQQEKVTIFCSKWPKLIE
jgi:hypothetical protein